MKLRKIYSYFINPMLAIFFIPIAIAYFKEEPIDYINQLIVAIVCGLVLGGIYSLWDIYKQRKKSSDLLSS